MTKSDFKYAMQRGLGSCALAIQSASDMEQYRDIILWGCLRNLSFDTQCEGTRARYLYELAAHYDNEAYFVEPVVAAFKKIRSTNGWGKWRFTHYCEILLCFAQAGNAEARAALYEKYNVLYQKLLRAHNGSRASWSLAWDFEALCIVLTSLDGIDRYLSTASDIGALFKKSRFTVDDFWCFIDNGKSEFGEKRICKNLLKAAEDSETLACFCDQIREQERVNRERRPVPTQMADTADELLEKAATGELSIAKRVQFRRAASDEEKKKLAEHILACDQPSVKAVLLSTFFGIDFPGPCEAIIADVCSENPQLQEAALKVLETCRDEAVRILALKLLSEKVHTANAICMLITNYCKNDKNALLKALYRLPVTYSNVSGWHGITRHILWAFEQGVCRVYPRELLDYIYRNSLCSGCREEAVKQLIRQKWLTSEIMNECHYDSNAHIREYIAHIQKEKKYSE
ncbi:hypothetical protein [Eubacterium sp. 1001713B170207_170306_E7]|uniref:hypothetical protein n=1 Tax=Eubacterium sp. 1001713B170207_170306_E7 TaxID=2787097 RepID=UPI001897CE9D|nr:hypothetical protein [Eubacterium sp. 1001713B170207_170306_E7]